MAVNVFTGEKVRDFMDANEAISLSKQDSVFWGEEMKKLQHLAVQGNAEW